RDERCGTRSGHCTIGREQDRGFVPDVVAVRVPAPFTGPSASAHCRSPLPVQRRLRSCPCPDGAIAPRGLRRFAPHHRSGSAAGRRRNRLTGPRLTGSSPPQRLDGDTIMLKRRFCGLAAGAALAGLFAFPGLGAAQEPITLHGASQFNDDHAFTKTMVKFGELVQKYYGKPINFVLHKNSELGLEKQYFEYMAQGKAVDFAVVSPAHMSTFSKPAPFIDAPFLFRDLDHWNKVLDADLFKPIADEIAKRADVMLIGYAGGGVRNIFANKAGSNLADIKDLKVRVQGAPIWSRAFQAAGMAPTVIAYSEVYNAIQNGVIAAGENEAAGVESMKFNEVAPNLMMTQHAITIRPLCFSGKTFKRLPKELQDAIVKAGKEAGAYGRQVESSEDGMKLDAMEKAGKLKRIAFTERDKLKSLVDPVI